MLLGDSITDNTQTGGLDWFTPANVAAGSPLGYAFERGTGGNTTAQMLARVSTDVTALLPKFCLVFGGANDAAAGTGSAATIANLVGIYDACTAAGIRIIAGTVLPRTGVSAPEELETITGTNAWLRANLTDLYPGSLLVDWNPAMADGDETTPVSAYFSDDIHPNSTGAAVMAGVLETALGTL